jgi:ABC-type branched-subunit amino acid transport system substrate-binding protein
MKLFIITVFSIVFVMLSSCVDSKVVKKDDKKIEHKDDKKELNNDSVNHTKNNGDNNTKKIDEKNNTKIDNDVIKEEKFNFEDTLTYKNVDLFALEFSKSEQVDSNFLDKFYQTIILLDHSNKYDALKSILPLLKDLENIPEKIKEIDKRYNTPYDYTKIGLIIPKNSKYKKLAMDIENGINLAQSRYKSNLKIIIKETDLTLESTKKATEELIFNDNVLMILGTIKTSNSEAVSLIAEKYRVPFISISKNNESVRRNSYSFSYFISIEYAASFMAKYAIEKLNLKKFAILYPDSKYGKQNMVAFWKTVEENGGEITAVRAYSPSKEADYIEPAKKLVGRYYLNSRSDYIAEKNKIKRIKSGYSLTKALETLEKDLEPKIDFDSIFIPDGSESTTILLPYLALYDINFKTNNKWQNFLATQKSKDKKYKLKFVQLLGTQTWSSDSIAEGAGKYIQGAIFPVIYNTRIDDKNISKFTSLYIKNYNRKPSSHSLYGYELFEILNNLLKNLEGENLRKKIVDELLIKNFKSVSGDIKFNKYGEANKSLFLMKFNSEKYKDYDGK